MVWSLSPGGCHLLSPREADLIGHLRAFLGTNRAFCAVKLSEAEGTIDWGVEIHPSFSKITAQLRCVAVYGHDGLSWESLYANWDVMS